MVPRWLQANIRVFNLKNCREEQKQEANLLLVFVSIQKTIDKVGEETSYTADAPYNLYNV